MKVHFAHKSLRRFALLSMFLILFGTLASMASNLNGDLNSFFNLTYSSILSPFGAKAGGPALAGQALTMVDPTVTTDKTGYLAGETVLISGAGFVQGDVVTLQVTRADGNTEPATNATAGSDGTIAASWVLREDAGNSFVLNASVSSGGLLPPVAFRRIAVVGTDRYDYQPGNTAIITGSGFRPRETVTILVEHSNGMNSGAGHSPFEAVAGNDGGISTTWYVDPDDSLDSISRFLKIGRIHCQPA